LERLLRHQKYWNASNRSSRDFWYLLYLWNIHAFLIGQCFEISFLRIVTVFWKLVAIQSQILWSFPLSKSITRFHISVFFLFWSRQLYFHYHESFGHSTDFLSCQKKLFTPQTWTDTCKVSKLWLTIRL
jgi:hypothetical protein